VIARPARPANAGWDGARMLAQGLGGLVWIGSNWVSAGWPGIGTLHGMGAAARLDRVALAKVSHRKQLGGLWSRLRIGATRGVVRPVGHVRLPRLCCRGQASTGRVLRGIGLGAVRLSGHSRHPRPAEALEAVEALSRRRRR
jgi:hypothetical protein